MFRFLLRRAAYALVLVFAVTSASFLLVHAAPGDYFTDIGPGARSQARAERAAAGFDRPLAERYVAWLTAAARLDLGTSLKYRRPVRELVASRMANTAILGTCALLVATLLGIPLGAFTATSEVGWLRTGVRTASSLLLASPSLVVVLVLTLAAANAGWLAPPGAHLANLVVPTLALALPAAALLERTHSVAVRGVLHEPYVRAVAARGVPRHLIVWKHVMRASLGLTLASYGALAGALLSGSFVVELVTDWPGLALLTADAVRARDPYLVSGCIGAAAVVLSIAVLASDLLHRWADPRVGEA